MKTAKKLLFLLTLIVSFTLYSESTSAASIDQEEEIKTIRDYIENSVDELNYKFEELKSHQIVNLEEIQNLIDSHYNENPAPEVMLKSNSLDIQDVFPELTKENNKAHEESKGNLGVFINTQKETNELGTVFTYKNDNSDYIDVYLGKTGDISILEFKTVGQSPETVGQSPEIQPLYAQKYTTVQRTTGISYNGLGAQLFTLWAEASFKYNGTTVASENIDGNYKRHMAGATLNLIPEAMPKTRTVSLEGYKYAEVYSRLRYQGGIGIKWAQLTITDATLEAMIGCTVDGSVYGGLRAI
ncbi:MULTISPECIES: hypothetical protein [Lysinibacillus]|uniref:Uncharacterized protein n=1 Tax=Lysinibacillus xylanilyticus TaxID=582475 RepID=A0ABV3VVT3_9BACI